MLPQLLPLVAPVPKEFWGPLHGVPITVKETVNVAGCATTAGLRQGPLGHGAPMGMGFPWVLMGPHGVTMGPHGVPFKRGPILKGSHF